MVEGGGMVNKLFLILFTGSGELGVWPMPITVPKNLPIINKTYKENTMITHQICLSQCMYKTV